MWCGQEIRGCSDPECRKAEKAERLAAQLAEKNARQQERAARGCGARGPLPVEGISTRAKRQQLQAARDEDGLGSRGPPPPDGVSTRAQRQQLQAAREEDGLGSRGPPPPDGVSTRAQRQQLQAAREEDGLGSRGPPPPDGVSTRAQRQLLQASREEDGLGSRGPKPDEDSTRAQRQQLQAAREEDGLGSRGPKPIATEIQKQGYPFPDEDTLTPEQVKAHYIAFTRSWGRFGLSRVCAQCRTLTPAKHIVMSKKTNTRMCKRCREDSANLTLPELPPIPDALQNLQPTRISQVLLDKLPAGGPSAQWGRMYAVLMEDP